MKVSIEDIPEVPVGTGGVLIRIRDEDNKNLGKLWFGSGRVRWAKGKVTKANAKSLSVEKFVDYLNQLP